MKSKPKFLRNQKPLSSQSLSKNSSFSKRKTPPFVGKKNNHQQSTNKSSHLPTFNNKVAHNPLQLQKISDLVIDLLTNDPKPIPGNVLFQKTIREIKNWGHNTFLKINDFYLVIDQLLAKKIIRKNIRDKYYLTYPNYPLLNEQTYQGTFQVGRGDFGFINYDEKQDDGKIVSHTYFVHKNNFDQAIDGDLVEFVLLDTSANFKKLGKNNDAKIIKVISHAKDFYVGEVVVNNDDPLVDQKYYVVLDNPKVNAKVTITNPLGLVAGHKVLVKINQFIPNNFRGEVIKIIGHKNDLGVDISSIVYDFGLNIDFTTEVIAESEQLLTDQKRFLTDPIRQDLTHIPFITIDPITSKDFDDAIFVSKQANHFLLQVAVADVSTYVKPQSALDQTAYQRGTSVYLLNSVIPMLPHLISDDLCSLLPNAVRCALVVTMEINFQGKVN